MTAVGIDFGTTNTVLAFPATEGVRVQTFARGADTIDAVRTTLSFRRGRQMGAPPQAEIGPWAIDQFLDSPEDTRFLQSFKTFAASPSFTDTAVFTRRYDFVALLRAFLERLREHAGGAGATRHAVVGRPVTFAGTSPDDGLAMRRYEAAFRGQGYEQVSYVLEPVAAAYFFAQRLTRDAVVLVGDFGGGTSDFSVIRFRRGKGQLKAEPLAHSGLGIAGDSFDYRIIDNVVLPLLGKNATYKSWGKALPVPVHYYNSFSRWNELCLMRRPEVLRELRELARASDSRSAIESLVDLIEGGVSYSLYRAVSAAKAALSQQDHARFQFGESGLKIDTVVRRSDFERWIADDLERIGAAADQALARANVARGEVDRVFLTGGTSYVPAVRRLFTERFPAERIDSGEQLVSIAKGLALIAATDEPEAWAMTA